MESINKAVISLCYILVMSLMVRSVKSDIHHELAYTSLLCIGSIAECNEEEEMVMESDISRRILEEKKYISEGALRRDKPVCNGGASGEAYSKSGGCLPPPSNPPDRGCSRYYRCRS